MIPTVIIMGLCGYCWFHGFPEGKRGYRLLLCLLAVLCFADAVAWYFYYTMRGYYFTDQENRLFFFYAAIGAIGCGTCLIEAYRLMRFRPSNESKSNQASDRTPPEKK
jgi:hypothetical protein